MREAAVAAAGTAVVAALTLQMQTAHSWVVGAAVADLATLHFSPTVTAMQEVVRHQAEQLTDSHLQVHPHVQPVSVLAELVAQHLRQHAVVTVVLLSNIR